MSRGRQWGWYAYWGLTLAVLGVAASMAILSPEDVKVGPVQKLLYLHLPVAVNTFLFAIVVFVASVAYIGGRRQLWDDLAHAGAAVTVLNGTVLLLTGMVWAKVAWGHWWMWSPRLSISLILWLLYTIYLAVRSRVRSPQRRAMICSIYGVVAFLDVPLLYLTVKLLPDIHPTESGLSPSTYPTLWVWFAAITLLSIGTAVARYMLVKAESVPGHANSVPPARGLSAEVVR